MSRGNKAAAGRVALAIATALLLAACGDDSSDGGDADSAAPATTTQTSGAATEEAYDITCAQVGDPRVSRPAQTALAADAQIPNLSQLQAAQSIFFAMTEICKDESDDFKPARDAIAGVREGRYRSGRPAGTEATP
jgi:hypothetical protein